MRRPPVRALRPSLRDALRTRVINCDAAAVARLLESGATAEGLTHDAVFCGVRDIVSLVLENGGDPNERNAVGETPVMIASRYGRADLVEVLLDWGADPEALSISGATALDHAQAWPPIEELLANEQENGGRASPKILRPIASLARKLSG